MSSPILSGMLTAIVAYVLANAILFASLIFIFLPLLLIIIPVTVYFLQRVLAVSKSVALTVSFIAAIIPFIFTQLIFTLSAVGVSMELYMAIVNWIIVAVTGFAGGMRSGRYSSAAPVRDAAIVGILSAVLFLVYMVYIVHEPLLGQVDESIILVIGAVVGSFVGVRHKVSAPMQEQKPKSEPSPTVQ